MPSWLPPLICLHRPVVACQWRPHCVLQSYFTARHGDDVFHTGDIWFVLHWMFHVSCTRSDIRVDRRSGICTTCHVWVRRRCKWILMKIGLWFWSCSARLYRSFIFAEDLAENISFYFWWILNIIRITYNLRPSKINTAHFFCNFLLVAWIDLLNTRGWLCCRKTWCESNNLILFNMLRCKVEFYVLNSVASVRIQFC